MPKFTVMNNNQTIEVAEGTSIIDMCEKNDTEVLFGCRSASCGTCMFRVKEGADGLAPPENTEKDFLKMINAAPDERLGCQARIVGDVKIEVID